MVQKVVSNASIGLNTEKMDEMNIPYAVMKFVNKKMMAPIPKRTIGQTSTMRQRILQISLFPDIFDKRGKSRSPGNVDFGEAHDTRD
jgi:hypothetical protein